MLSSFAMAVAAMIAVVAASNYLVQFPVEFVIAGANLADVLTWGAFTYPAAFLVTDLTNSHFGPRRARQVAVFGFVVAVVLSIWLASPRIAIASGSAFLLAQLIDVQVFHRLRRHQWWVPPAVSGLIATVLDTLVFFSLAFAPAFGFLDTAFGAEDNSLGFPTALLWIGPEVPLFLSLALGDFIVKLAVGIVFLIPYRALHSPNPEPRAA
jgi:uncharacterized PurR-regulated membrane protein YhhQ (DUF165 family)